jgi:hypothetical protein
MSLWLFAAFQSVPGLEGCALNFNPANPDGRRCAGSGVSDLLAKMRVLGILNFAPVRLQISESVSLVEVDLAVQLEQLSFLVSSQKNKSREAG